MKKYIILAIFLAAGLSAYPQVSRSGESNKSSQSRSAQKSVSSSSRGATKSSGNVSRSQSSQSKSSGTVSRSQSSQSKSSGTVSRSQSSQSKSSGNVSRSQSNQSKSSGNVGRTQSEQRKTTGTITRSQSTQSKSSGSVGRTQSEQRKSTGTVSRTQSEQRKSTGTVGRTQSEQRKTEGAVRSSSSSPVKTTGVVRSTRSADNKSDDQVRRATTGVSGSGASRVMRESRNTLIMNDGREINHDNDRVFTHTRHNLNYRDYHDLRRSDDFIRVHRHYYDWRSRRVIRIVHHNHYYPAPLALEIRRMRYPYRHPVYINMVWTPSLLHRFMFYYPHWESWRYDFGAHIEDISAYDAEAYAGSVKRIYGKVEEVYYSPEDENYVLYFGAPFPYHDMTVVIPRHIAKDISLNPKWYFENEHVWVVGLIEMWEGKPEVVVHDEDQIRRY